MEINIDKDTKVSNEIGCEAINCIYNGPKRQCYAENIKVGTEHATNSVDTECTTFKLR